MVDTCTSAKVCTSAASELRLQRETLRWVTLPNVWEKKATIIFAVFSFWFRRVCRDKGGRWTTMWGVWLTYWGKQLTVAAQVESCHGRGFSLSSTGRHMSIYTQTVKHITKVSLVGKKNWTHCSLSRLQLAEFREFFSKSKSHRADFYNNKYHVDGSCDKEKKATLLIYTVHLWDS